jgi:hypothetical protein
MLRDGNGQPQMLVEIAVRPLAVQVGQPRVVRTGARDQHVVDRPWQVAEEPVEGGRIGGVEGRRAQRADFLSGVLKPLGIAAGQDDIGALGAGAAGGLEPDAGAAADHHDGLPGQFRFALGDSDSGMSSHA